ncbi:MAG: cell division protein FtsB [Comamonadaceae bacterium]|jgi:cell division protein FtsB|nr:cell division protein FtsB [Comamonadaceae bacterium]
MVARLVPLVLLALLGAIHAQLWTGRGSVHHVRDMQQRIAEQQAENDKARQENARLQSEVNDLKEGLDMVEEKARYELGMVKPGEVYVHVAPPKP